MSHKYYGVVRVMNTLTQGTAVAGLEAGSAVLCKEATEAVQHIYPDSIIAVTNHHVVGEQKNVMLNFHFSQIPFPASVLKVCPQYDLAFLHINKHQDEFKIANFDHATQSLRHVELIGCDSILFNKLDTYADVVSVGFPLGTPHQTITKGNVTAKDMMNGNVVFFHDSLIVPGNSGGALLHKGKLVGINTAIKNSGNVISIATPIETVQSLFGFLTPTLRMAGMTPEAYRQLLSMFHLPVAPNQLVKLFDKHHCGGFRQDGSNVSFFEWFDSHCLHKPESHGLLQNVLEGLHSNIDTVHQLRQGGWVKCASCTYECKSKPSVIAPDRIVFNEHFSVSNTIPVGDRLIERYGAEGVVITDAKEHEPVKDGQLLVGINGRALDNYGNFIDNGAPYFTAFKYYPGQEVRLNIATLDRNIDTINYTYDHVTELPLIHSPQMTPFTPPHVLKVGGLKIMQMNAAMAKVSYPEYLKAPLNDKVVGVVVEVDYLCPEWNIQKISPGHLLTKVNGQEMQGSLEQAVKNAEFLTFQGKSGSIVKLM